MKIRYELELPAKPKVWGGETKISADGRTATYYVEGGGGSDWLSEGNIHTFASTWTVADGDPEGVYTVRFYVGDSKIPFATFTFKIVKP